MGGGQVTEKFPCSLDKNSLSTMMCSPPSFNYGVTAFDEDLPLPRSPPNSIRTGYGGGAGDFQFFDVTLVTLSDKLNLSNKNIARELSPHGTTKHLHRPVMIRGNSN